MTKLVNTGNQVDDLKAKLAAQEVELKQKNEDADKLIQKVSTAAVHACVHTRTPAHTRARAHARRHTHVHLHIHTLLQYK